MDERRLDGLTVLDAQARVGRDAVQHGLRVWVGRAEAVEAAAHGHRVHCLLRPADHRLDGEELRRDGDAEVLQDVSAAVVAHAQTVPRQLGRPQAEQVGEHVLPLLREVGAERHRHAVGRGHGGHPVPRVRLRSVVDLAATLTVRVAHGGLVAHQTTAFLLGSRFVVTAAQRARAADSMSVASASSVDWNPQPPFVPMRRLRVLVALASSAGWP